MTTPNANDTKVEASATTCIVGCKLPNGATLELTTKDGETIRFQVNGMNAARIVGGYGLTDGIPRDFMETWLKRHHKLKMVRDELIFIHSDVASAEAHAKAGREVKTGMEPIDPLKDQRGNGIVMDAQATAAYMKQVRENPLRNRQIVE